MTWYEGETKYKWTDHAEPQQSVLLRISAGLCVYSHFWYLGENPSACQPMYIQLPCAWPHPKLVNIIFMHLIIARISE